MGSKAKYTPQGGMIMKLFTVSNNNLKFGDRLVPSFYYYTTIIKEEHRKKGIEYFVLGDYASVSDGEHSAIPRNNKEGIRYLYGRNIKEGVVDFDPISDDSYIYPYDYESFKRCHIKENDVLIAIYGTVGKSAIYKEEYIGVAGIPRHISNITLKKNAPITPEYLTAYFRSKEGKKQIFSTITGNIQQLFSLKNIRQFEVPIIDNKTMSIITENEKTALNYEMEANKRIKAAQSEFYNGLKFDIKAIIRDFCFSVNSEDVFKNNTWSMNFYDRLYVKVADALVKNNGCYTIREIATTKHGDEVGSNCYKEFVDRDLSDKSFIRTSDIVNHEVDLYPDYYIDQCDAKDVKQKCEAGDVIFTKDGKVGCTGMITSSDDVILSSGIEIIRLKESAKKEGLTQEYLFTALSIQEVGLYGAIRRTVVASTIPHLREERLRDIEIPKMEKKHIERITELIKEAFELKSKRKELLKKNYLILEKHFA